MIGALRRLRGDGQAGLTLIEMLVAAAMSVVIVGAAMTMLISAVKTQPELSQRSQDISTARFVLERMTREIRNGIAVDSASGSSVSFRTYVRHTACGASSTLSAGSSAILCQVTYTCTATSCSRVEANPGIYTGTAKPIFSGIDSDKVFNFSPDVEEPSFVGVTLRFPNPEGNGHLTVSDGANLRSTGFLGS
jgi:type II secretory pathway pseudopilin PulG